MLNMGRERSFFFDLGDILENTKNQDNKEAHNAIKNKRLDKKAKKRRKDINKKYGTK